MLRVFKGDMLRPGIDALVGNTPLVRLKGLSKATGCNVLGKAEWMNPGGSVKDRAALGLIAAAERSGVGRFRCRRIRPRAAR
jgi:cysteine synthase A